MSKLKIEIKKCSIPIIWLDTSVLINLTLFKLNKLKHPHKSHFVSLYNRIVELTRKGKLICPKASQASEIWGCREDFLNTLNFLSLGISTSVKAGIKDNQIYCAMQGYSKGAKALQFNFLDAFINDPVKKLKENDCFPFIISVDTGLLDSVENVKTDRKKINYQFENLRKYCRENKITFEEQLKKERLGEISIIHELSFLAKEKFAKRLPLSSTEYWCLYEFQLHRLFWSKCGGNDVQSFLNFFNSEYYFECPYIYVNSTLFAHIMTSPNSIAHGDSMDIEHISTLLPYVDMMVLDRKMKNLVKKYSLDKKYNTRVTYIGDFKEIDEFFNCIERP